MILVTGQGGLFGRALTARLRTEGREFVVVERGSGELHDGDLRYRPVAKDALEKNAIDTIIHLAGGRGKDRSDLFERNVLTTVNLIEAAAAGPRRPAVIVMGSAAEYGPGEGQRLSENDPLRPISDYGIAKVAQTALALSMGERLSVPVSVLRPFNPVSPELTRDVALGNARAQLLEGATTLHLGRLDVVRDFVPLDFIVEAILNTVDRAPAGRAINICSGVGLKLEDIVMAMAELVDVPIRTEVDVSLAALPAGDVVVGDPTLMERTLGLRTNPTPAMLAGILLSDR
jgi:GDP-4-dehydro-6-deoxy-D-mannose reductase